MIDILYDVIVLVLICSIVWEVVKLRKSFIRIQERLTRTVLESKDVEGKLEALCNMITYMYHTKKKVVKKKK